MKTSEKTDQLFAALVKARAEITNAGKTKSNPFFKSKYADLETVQDACHEAFRNNDICVVQGAEYENGTVYVDTLLGHVSGQWVSSRAGARPVKDDPQGIGSSITYLRRYGLAAMAGIAQTDDDGNAGSGHVETEAAKPASRMKRSPVVLRDQTGNVVDGKTEVAGLKPAQVEQTITELHDSTTPPLDPKPEPTPEETMEAFKSVANEIVRLKWPTSQTVGFLKNKYGVDKISQLTLEQAKAARAWLADLKPVDAFKKSDGS